MRAALLATVLFVIAMPAFAQRPWTKVTHPPVGSQPVPSVAIGALYLFDSTTLVSYNQGMQWDPIAAITSCKAIVEFVNNTTVAIAQPKAGSDVYTSYTLSGITWTPSDTLDLNGKSVLTSQAVSDVLYIVTTNGWIYKWSSSIDSVSMNLPEGSIVRDYQANEALQIALTSNGLFVSKNDSEFHLQNPPSASDSPDVTTAITKRGNTMYASTEKGVFVWVDTLNSWEEFGHWPTDVITTDVSGMASDDAHVIAMLRTTNGRHQLYRMDLPDSNWLPTGYELPMDQPTMLPRGIVIDAGWAVTYQFSAVMPDSTGLYVFNLNDFTHVTELANASTIEIHSNASGLTVTSGWEGAWSLDILTTDGRLVVSTNANGNTAHVQIPTFVHGLLCVVARQANGRILRGVVLR